MKRKLLLTLLVLAASSWSSSASAVTKTWDGSSSTSWNLDANWSPSGVPTSSDDVLLNSTFNVALVQDVTATVNSVNIATGHTAAITQSGSRKLEIAGDFTYTGNANFTAPASVMSIGGKFNKTSSGTFTHNSGSVILTATGADQTHTFGGAVFNKLVINDGMVGYWKLDDSSTPTSGSTTAVDSSGFANTMTHYGPPALDTNVPTTVYYNPRGLAFAKAHPDSIRLGSVPTSFKNTTWTVTAWFKATSLSVPSGDPKTGQIVNVGNAYVLQVLDGGTATTAKVSSSFYGASSWKGCDHTTTITLNDGVWHFGAMVNDGTAVTVYSDGTPYTCAAHGTTQNFVGPDAQPDVYIGGNIGDNTYSFDGSIDDVRVFNRALTGSNIQAMAAGSAPGTNVKTMTASDAISSDELIIVLGKLTGTSTIGLTSNWKNYGGLFTGTGTVTLSPTASGKVIISNGQRFSNLTIDGTGGTTSIRDPLYVDGTLTLSAGTLNATSGYAFPFFVGTWNQSGGTYTNNGGSVVLMSSSDSALTSTASGPFKNLWVEDPTETGLVSYWKMDDVTGTSVRDWTGSNTGTLTNGARWITSTLGPTDYYNIGSVYLDGTDDYISVGTTSLPANNVSQTISAWVKFASVPASTQTIVGLVKSSATAGSVQLGFKSSLIKAWKYDGTVLASGTAPSTNTWHHIAYTYDGTTHKIYIDGGSPAGTPNGTSTTAPDAQTPVAPVIGRTSSSGEYFAGYVDDVRIYNTTLTGAQIVALATGYYAGTGGTATVTMAADTTAHGNIMVESGTLDTSSYALLVSDTTNHISYVNGTLKIGSGTASFGIDSTNYGGLVIQPTGTLKMTTAGGILQIGNTGELDINGTFDASSTTANPTIKAYGGTGAYTFLIGTTSTSTPTLNIRKLQVQDTDTNGMFINYNAGSSTTITHFDNVTFSSGTGNSLLQLGGSSAYLSANGCSFDNSTTYNVKVTGDGTANGETRATFGNTTCTNSPCESYDQDDDNSPIDGVADTPATTGGVAQFISQMYDDTAGNIEGFPVIAFNWSNYSYWKTYVAFNNYSGTTTHRLFARTSTGADTGYYWDIPASEGTFVGSPRYSMEGGSNHYVYIATSLGRVYKIQDTGAALNTVAGWPYFNGGTATVTSPLGADTNNLYWAGADSVSALKMWSAKLTDGTLRGSRSIAGAITAAPAIATISNADYVFSGTSGKVTRMTTDMGAEIYNQTTPNVTSAVNGRIQVVDSLAYFFENIGKIWALSTSDLNSVDWSYQATGTSGHSSCSGNTYCTVKNFYIDPFTKRVYYGDEDGHIYVIYKNGASASILGGFGVRPTGGYSTDSIVAAPVYRSGVVVYGSSTGKVWVYDQQKMGSVPDLIQMYHFGSAVSSISYQSNSGSTSQYVIGTSSGRLYYIDVVADPSNTYN